MSNKKIFKKLYSKKINKDNNYQSILERIENNNEKNNIWKRVLFPIGSLAIICGLIFININTPNNTLKSSELIDEQNKDLEIYINDNANTSSYTSDANIKIIDANYEELIKSSKYSFLTDIIIPNDLNNKIYQEIYVNANTNEANTNSSYTILNNYDFRYQSTSNNRSIILSFSDKYTPLRDYVFSDKGKVSKINDTEFIIYQNKNSYITTFTYNNINFDIETNNITKEELIALLTSIIK